MRIRSLVEAVSHIDSGVAAFQARDFQVVVSVCRESGHEIWHADKLIAKPFEGGFTDHDLLFRHAMQVFVQEPCLELVPIETLMQYNSNYY